MGNIAFGPLYERLNRKGQRWALIIISSMLGLLVSASNIAVPFYFQIPQLSSYAWQIGFRLEEVSRLASVVFTLALPFFVTYLTAFLVTSYVKSLEYPMLLGTSLSDRETVSNLWALVQKRCEIVLAFQIGVLPALVLNYMIEPFAFLRAWHNGMNSDGAPTNMFSFGLRFVPAIVALAAFVLSANRFAASLALLISVFWRNAIVAGSVAAVVVLFFLIYVFRISYEISFNPMLAINTQRAIIGYALAGLISWITSKVILQLSERWVRR